MLAYNATVSLDARQYGSLLVFSAIARDKRITAETLLAHWEMVLHQIRDLPQHDEHLLRARNKIRRHYAQSYQTTEGLADELAIATLLFNDPEHPWKELTHLTSIEYDEVIELANVLCKQQPAIVQYSTVEP
jgi:predicted Zn-dependent peptidase